MLGYCICCYFLFIETRPHIWSIVNVKIFHAIISYLLRGVSPERTDLVLWWAFWYAKMRLSQSIIILYIVLGFSIYNLTRSFILKQTDTSNWGDTAKHADRSLSVVLTAWKHNNYVDSQLQFPGCLCNMWKKNPDCILFKISEPEFSS